MSIFYHKNSYGELNFRLPQNWLWSRNPSLLQISVSGSCFFFVVRNRHFNCENLVESLHPKSPSKATNKVMKIAFVIKTIGVFSPVILPVLVCKSIDNFQPTVASYNPISPADMIVVVLSVRFAITNAKAT